MPDRVSSRIALAFVAVGLIATLALGGGLFVSLRNLHRQESLATLGDIAQPVAARLRPLAALQDVRRELASAAPALRSEIGVYGIFGGGLVVSKAARQPVDLSSITVDPAQAPGQSTGGELTAADGSRVLYSVTVVRGPNAPSGPVAILLTLPDNAGSEALHDLAQVIPIVLLITVAAGLPIVWILSRSITRPLKRLATATAALPGSASEPVPMEGPLEVRDLTERFNVTGAELERVRAEERELLANIRHDLRTPLTVVTGFAEALRDGTASGPHVARAGEAIAQEAARMERLIDDLRSVDEIRAGRIGIRPEALDPAALVSDATARFATQAAAAGVEVSAASDLGLSLVADRAAVERILGNLVTNALASVPRGGRILVEARASAGPPTVAARADAPPSAAARHPAGPVWIAFRVSDDGPGFPPGTLERVFDRLYRADPSRSGGGSGLGLSIVRAFAAAHGGQAVAENLAPTGARVTILLPPVPVPASEGTA